MGGFLLTKIDPNLRLSIDNRLWKSIASNEKEEFNEQVQWCDLPSIPLETIYSFLSRADQVNMSLVCRNWSEGFGSPSVWRTFRFDLKESQLSMDICPVMKFVHKYSNMFRHVEIKSSFSMNNDLMKSFCRHVIEFLQILTRNTQLISVEFQSFTFCLWHMDNPPYNEICRSIADFLESQNHLKRVEFDYCFFGYQETVEILRILSEKSRESLTHLKLRGFISHRTNEIEQGSNVVQKLPMLTEFPNLNTLDTDYSFILENMVSRQRTALKTVKNCKTLILSKLILEYDSRILQITEFRSLTSSDWIYLEMLSPNLQVELIIRSYAPPSLQEMQLLIVPKMPITRLDYKCWELDMGTETDVLFGHLLLCKTNDYLVTIHLDLDVPALHLPLTLISFLQACKKLKCLELFLRPPIYCPFYGIDVLLESWLENRQESLQKVIIDVSCLLNENDFPGFMKITEYVSLLKVAGLNIRVNLH